MRKFKIYSKTMFYLLFSLMILLSSDSCKSQSIKKSQPNKKEQSTKEMQPKKELKDISELWITQYQLDEIEKMDSLYDDSTFQPTGNFKIIEDDTLYQFIKYPKIEYIVDDNMSSDTSTEYIIDAVVKSAPPPPPPPTITIVSEEIKPIIQEEPTTQTSPSEIVSSPEVEIKMGSLVYHIPDTMIKKKTYTLRLRINRDTSDKSILLIDNGSVSTVIKTTSKMEIIILWIHHHQRINHLK